MDNLKYPLTDPKWFGLNILVEAIIERQYQEQRTKLNVKEDRFSKTKEENDANEVLKEKRFSKKDGHHVLKMTKRNGLKRTYATFTNDDEQKIHVLDQERVQEDESFKNKMEKSKGAADTIFDLPQEFKNKISEMGGNEITLVIQKSLYQTDLNPQHNRLSMPLKQIKNASFLREGELQILEKKQGIEVLLIEPSLELRSITLAKWNMPKITATNSYYVLRSSWTKVAVDNQLKAYDVVQVWSFRVQEELCLALVKV